jgi:hypothetical protein
MELDALCTRCGRHYAGPAEGCPSCDGPLGAGNYHTGGLTMSADLPREVLVLWGNERDEDEEAVVLVYGHADFTLAEWAEAFKAQNRNLLRRVGAADDLSVYVELDLG